MFEFDFKKSNIFKIVRFTKNPVFRLLLIFRVVFLILSIFLIGFFLLDLILNGLEMNGFLLGSSLIFLTITIFLCLIRSFVEAKYKYPKKQNIVNSAEALSFDVAKPLTSALAYAKSKKIFPVTPSLFLRFLIKDKRIDNILVRLLIDKKDLERRLLEYSNNEALSQRIYSEKFEQAIKYAIEAAKGNNHYKVKLGDMFIGLVKTDPVIGGVLLDLDLKPEDVERVVNWYQRLEDRREYMKRFWEYDNLSKMGSMGRGFAAGYTIKLDQYGSDLVIESLRKGFEDVKMYSTEIDQVERILSNPTIDNVLLVGEPGVGAKDIIRLLSIKSYKGESLPKINHHRIVDLRLNQLLSQAQGIDEVESILNEIFQESLKAGNVILVLDEFHNYIATNQAPGTIDISGVISEYLARPEFRVIAISSYSGLHKRIEQNPAILNLFSKVEVKEPSPEQTLELLQELVPGLESKYGKIITHQALEQSVDLANRYIADIPFPKKAKEVLEEAVTAAGKIVLPRDVDKVVTQKTEIPVGKIEEKEKEVLLNLEDLIHERIINQNTAVREVSTALRRSRAKLKKQKGPMGGFLFLGPTGVGKTETAKALSAIYFNSEDRMIRLDMSEFQTDKDIPRLLGGEGQEGLLTTPVRENPFSLILLDEIEKAHPNILNLFLQVLDEGHITDGMGRKLDFSNTIIIATSNAGYKKILKAMDEERDFSELKQEILDELFEQGMFRPEFINRFDAVVLFKPLTKDNLLDICQLLLNNIVKGLDNKNIDLVVTDELKVELVRLGYDITYGARNLKRTIQDKAENVLAEALLRGDIKKGDRISLNNKFQIIKL
jgi:ATP-dependent Clp protease ATP-binding subunit ClpC